jgi:hypothetical protein
MKLNASCSSVLEGASIISVNFTIYIISSYVVPKDILRFYVIKSAKLAHDHQDVQKYY